jgi:hypothetical protein
LTEWLVEQKIQEVVMESTAQYWRPAWHWSGIGKRNAKGGKALDRCPERCIWLKHSRIASRGRKKDMDKVLVAGGAPPAGQIADAERLLKRLVSQELILSFVPDAEQRLWRTVVRRKYQLTRDRVRFQNQLEALLEETQVKLSSMVSDLCDSSNSTLTNWTTRLQNY